MTNWLPAQVFIAQAAIKSVAKLHKMRAVRVKACNLYVAFADRRAIARSIHTQTSTHPGIRSPQTCSHQSRCTAKRRWPVLIVASPAQPERLGATPCPASPGQRTSQNLSGVPERKPCSNSSYADWLGLSKSAASSVNQLGKFNCSSGTPASTKLVRRFRVLDTICNGTRHKTTVFHAVGMILGWCA